MHAAIPMEPHIYPFTTVWKTIHGQKTAYLSTSPEAGLKRILSRDHERVYEISHAFRNLEESGYTHTPEFLMLEWYRCHAGYTDIMDEVQTYIQSLCGPKIDYQGTSITMDSKWPRRSVSDLFKMHLGVKLDQCLEEASMQKLAASRGYVTDHATWEQLFFQLFLNEIEPHIGNDPVFITEYPSRISPLAQPSVAHPHLAERFELYIGGMEIGNGNTENTDEDAVRALSMEEYTYRKTRDIDIAPIDEPFLSSLTRLDGLSPAGVGIGLDRLTLILGDFSDTRIFTSFG